MAARGTQRSNRAEKKENNKKNYCPCPRRCSLSVGIAHPVGAISFWIKKNNMCPSLIFDFGGICVTFVTFFPINLSGSTFSQLFSKDGSFMEAMAPLLMPLISSAYSPLKEVTMDADWNFLPFEHKNHRQLKASAPCFPVIKRPLCPTKRSLRCAEEGELSVTARVLYT